MSKKESSDSYFKRTYGKPEKEQAPKEELPAGKRPRDTEKTSRPKPAAGQKKPFETREGSGNNKRSFKPADREQTGKRNEGFPKQREDKRGGPKERSFEPREGSVNNKRSFRPADSEQAGKRNERFPKQRDDKRSGGPKERPFQRKKEEEPNVLRRNDQVHLPKIGAHLKPRHREEEDIEDMPVPGKTPEKMPLNKYIAHCGICSRRDAVELIKQGKVKVNGELVTEPGLKINEGDAVTVSGKKILPQRNLTYVLLNKPKGFITTTEDDKGRRTIMDLVSGSAEQRLYPIGRLDRNTTGLIILTNDGELSQKLSHPKYNIRKVYQVTLDKAISKADFDQIVAGVTLEDGPAPVDSLAMLDEKNELGIELHSGKNRIVRRIFEHLGYQVEKLDRVMYAGLTKKNLPRGKWRLLTEREVILLKHFKS